MQALAVLLAIIAAAGAGLWYGADYEQGRIAQRDLTATIGAARRYADDTKKGQQTDARVSDGINRESAARDAQAKEQRNVLAGIRAADLVQCPVADTGGVANPAVAAVAADPPAVRLSADGVREYNRALALGTLQAERAGWIADADAGAGPAEIKDAIQNLADNAEKLGACRAREVGWHQWATEQGMM